MVKFFIYLFVFFFFIDCGILVRIHVMDSSRMISIGNLVNTSKKKKKNSDQSLIIQQGSQPELNFLQEHPNPGWILIDRSIDLSINQVKKLYYLFILFLYIMYLLHMKKSKKIQIKKFIKN